MFSRGDDGIERSAVCVLDCPDVYFFCDIFFCAVWFDLLCDEAKEFISEFLCVLCFLDFVFGFYGAYVCDDVVYDMKPYTFELFLEIRECAGWCVSFDRDVLHAVFCYEFSQYCCCRIFL